MIDAFNARLRARKLIRLLDEERIILLAGRLAELPALCASRDLLFQSLGQESRVNARAMAEFGHDIRIRAERNHRLLGAALEGMKSARTIGAKNDADQAMQTYTASGKRVSAGAAHHQAGRRA